jgi:hypothetical protein
MVSGSRDMRAWNSILYKLLKKMERETGIEPATNSLEG